MTTMQGTADKTTPEEQESTLVRVEANLEELPVFSAAKRARREDVVLWSREGRDPTTHRPIRQRVTIRPAVGLGLPGERERDLYYLVLAPWLERHGFGDDGRIGPIRYQDACEMLGWKRSGRSYELVREALKTLVSVQLEFENAIVDGQTRKLIERGGGLFTEYAMYGESSLDTPARISRGVFSLKSAPWFQANWEANYLKPIDTAVYRALRTPLAKALYSYLDKRAWRRGSYTEQVSEDLIELRERFRLGVKKTKHLLEEFRRAHDDLRQSWPLLQEVRLEKVTPGRYRAVYVFSTQVSLSLDAAPEASSKPAADPMGESDPQLVEQLRQRGLNPARSADLVRAYPAERIRRQLDIHDQELKHVGVGQITNPPGRLYKRIVEDWAPFDAYKSPDVLKRVHKTRAAAAAKERAENEALEAERARFDALTPEEKANVRLARYMAFQSVMGPVSAEQREQKYREYLDEYLLQEESKIS